MLAGIKRFTWSLKILASQITTSLLALIHTQVTQMLCHLPLQRYHLLVSYFNGDQLKTPLTGNTEAPRGHYVYNIREIDRQSKVSNRAADGVPTNTITQVLSCSTNLSGLGGDLIYADTVPTGESTDPPSLPGGGGGAGGDIFEPLDPPGFWDEP